MPSSTGTKRGTITKAALAYTNHTLLPEALEKWPLAWFELLLPRQLEIVLEINRRLLADVRTKFPADEGRVARMSLIEEGANRKIRMANLAIVGSHSTNGVAKIHSNLLRTQTVADLAEMFPERFNNKTNGVTPRRWLLLCNPDLADAITAAIGDGWITDLVQLRQLTALANDSPFRDAVAKAKRRPKRGLRPGSNRPRARSSIPTLSSIAKSNGSTNTSGNCSMRCGSSCFTTSCEKIPASTSRRGRSSSLGRRRPPTSSRSSSSNSSTIWPERSTEILPYEAASRSCSCPIIASTLAERLIPASDVSNQISTAGYEASGTSNMKFMMNGALTVGTRDGATIEMAEEAGEENFFLFGLTAEQVADSRGWYDPRWHYEHERKLARRST